MVPRDPDAQHRARVQDVPVVMEGRQLALYDAEVGPRAAQSKSHLLQRWVRSGPSMRLLSNRTYWILLGSIGPY